MREYWAQIDGAVDGYMVSNMGRVKGLRKPFMGQHDNGLGYLQCKIKMKDGSSRFLKVHRMVATAFIPNPFGLSDVNHINGDKTDNRAENLAWTSHSENVRHAWATGLHERKMKATGREKLTEQQVREIRSSDLSHSKLAEAYGVSQPCITEIKKRRIYKWVK